MKVFEQDLRKMTENLSSKDLYSLRTGIENSMESFLAENNKIENLFMFFLAWTEAEEKIKKNILKEIEDIQDWNTFVDVFQEKKCGHYRFGKSEKGDIHDALLDKGYHLLCKDDALGKLKIKDLSRMSLESTSIFDPIFARRIYDLIPTSSIEDMGVDDEKIEDVFLRIEILPDYHHHDNKAIVRKRVFKRYLSLKGINCNAEKTWMSLKKKEEEKK